MKYRINLDILKPESQEEEVFNGMPEFIKGKQELHEILQKLLSEQYDKFVEGVDWVSAKPLTFRIHLKNDEFFLLQVAGNYWEAIISGKKYKLTKKTKLEKASKSITRLLQYLNDTDEADNPDFENDEVEKFEDKKDKNKEDLKESKIKFRIILNEVSLKSDDLEKPYYSNMPLYSKGYNNRGERFLEKILKNEPLELNNGGSILIDTSLSSETIDKMKNGDFRRLILFDKEGNKYPLSKFKKTEEFGGQVLKDAKGAAKTAIQESAQCVINALIYYIKSSSITKEDLTEENLNKTQSYIDISENFSEVKDFILKGDESWQNSLIEIGNKLYSTFKNDYTFHRDSKWVQHLIKQFYRAARLKGLNIQKDKWNPADIWMLTSEVKNIEWPDNLDELNTMIKTLFKEKKLIPVSLKKTNGSPTVTIYNMSKDDYKQKHYKEYQSSQKAKDSKIFSEEGQQITLRNFQGDKQFAGEIQGKNTMMGKIGVNNINTIFKLHGIENPVYSSAILSNIFKEKGNELKTLLSDFLKLYKKYTGGTKEQFEEKYKQDGRFWGTSKYQSLRVVDAIEKQPKDIQDKIIDELLSIASSQTPISSVFVKVS